MPWEDLQEDLEELFGDQVYDLWNGTNQQSGHVQKPHTVENWAEFRAKYFKGRTKEQRRRYYLNYRSSHPYVPEDPEKKRLRNKLYRNRIRDAKRDLQPKAKVSSTVSVSCLTGNGEKGYWMPVEWEGRPGQ